MNFSVFNFKLDLSFQSSASPIMEGIVDLHNHIFFFLILVFVFVFWVFGNILYHFWWKIAHPKVDEDVLERVSLVNLRHVSHNTSLEVIWTIIPSLILIAIAVPSFALLYAMDEIMEPTLTLKIVGHQWYWSYEYSNCISQLQYNGLKYPELLPESLWNRVWANAAYFYNDLVLGDTANISQNAESFEEIKKNDTSIGSFDPIQTLELFLSLNDGQDISSSEIAFIDPLEEFAQVFLSLGKIIPGYNSLGYRTVEGIAHYNSTLLLEEGRLYSLFLQNLKKLPSFADTEELYTWLSNQKTGNVETLTKKLQEQLSMDRFVTLEALSKVKQFTPFSYPVNSFFDLLSFRLEHKAPAFPVSYYDIGWFFDFWLRKLITGKVVEGLSGNFNLTGKADTLPGVKFDSYMLNEEELLKAGDYRLLEVDEPLVLPINTHIRLLITADDVLHSFAVPQFGVKVDAVPGRLNQQGLFIKRRGTFYGQCSELCGVNHGFMPIVVKAVSMKEFVHWYLHKFNMLYPEFGLSLVNPKEVKDFFEHGIFPEKFANYFSTDHLTVAESLVGDKTGSDFNLVNVDSVSLHQNLALIIDRFCAINPGLLQANWSHVRFEGVNNYVDVATLGFSPLETFALKAQGKNITNGIALDWEDPVLYKKISLNKPSLFLLNTAYLPSGWTIESSKLIAAENKNMPVVYKIFNVNDSKNPQVKKFIDEHSHLLVKTS